VGKLLRMGYQNMQINQKDHVLLINTRIHRGGRKFFPFTVSEYLPQISATNCGESSKIGVFTLLSFPRHGWVPSCLRDRENRY
jgi:hypothetical protein